eukprot:2499541-Rhodomonas_salina.3
MGCDATSKGNYGATTSLIAETEAEILFVDSKVLTASEMMSYHNRALSVPRLGPHESGRRIQGWCLCGKRSPIL